ncbi:uncharacterized protein [Hyperolius riggenbachi]|uniref:uncharacterized protein n=1 Tax=Hyperolius riggenbachi TaxID=752182 RepID=UPI0035A3949A
MANGNSAGIVIGSVDENVLTMEVAEEIGGSLQCASSAVELDVSDVHASAMEISEEFGGSLEGVSSVVEFEDSMGQEVLLNLEPIVDETTSSAGEGPSVDVNLPMEEVELEGQELRLHMSSNSPDTPELASATSVIDHSQQGPASDQHSPTSLSPPSQSREDFNTARWHSRQFLQAQRDYRRLMSDHMSQFHDDLAELQGTGREISGTLGQGATVAEGKNAILLRFTEVVALLADAHERQNQIMLCLADVAEAQKDAICTLVSK